jgi:mono/diheme cytochrome c family protein
MKKPLLLTLSVCAWAADAPHGSSVLRDQSCMECHTVNAEGAGHEANATAPDLAAGSLSAYTPAAFASGLWNHTPAMWNQISAKGATWPALGERDWSDVFAYLYSERIFQLPAQTRRGQQVFTSKGCADCHSLVAPSQGPGLPVSAWKNVDDAAALTVQLWNHASSMQQTFAARKREWPKLDGRDFADLALYVEYLQKLAPEYRLSLPEAATGKLPFEQNCQRCHHAPFALETRLANKTFLDIGAGVWNHVPLMGAFPTVPEADLRKILAYVWELQYQGPQGNVSSGRQVFAAKGCSGCHGGARIPSLLSPGSGKVVTPFSIAAIAWGSNRQMHRALWNKADAWPTLSSEEVSDLVAYLNYVSRK